MRFSHHRTPVESIQEYGRGIAGGLIFALPLLYTMEFWLAGFIFHPARLLVYIPMTFALLLIYNRFAGLRRDASMWEVAIDSIEELGIGLVLSAAVLWLTGRIAPDMQVREIAGKIVLQSLTVAVGVSVGTAQLGAKDPTEESGFQGDRQVASHSVPQLGLAFCGAILFAANIAPTEEVHSIAYATSAYKLVLLSLCSISLSVVVLHFAEFRGSHVLQHDGISVIIPSAASTYAVALIAAALTLWFCGQFDQATLAQSVKQTVVLGLPAALGASAGRLLIQPDQ